MGSQGIPSTVGGHGAVERAGLEDQHGGNLSRFGPQVMRNTLLLLVCVYLVFLDYLQSVQGPKNPNPSLVRVGPAFIVQRGRHSGTHEVESM